MGKNRACKACCETSEESESYYHVQKNNEELMQLIRLNPNYTSYSSGASSKDRVSRNTAELLKTQESLLRHLREEIIKENDRFKQERLDLMYITYNKGHQD